MAFVYAVNAAVPAPTDKVKLGDDAIRDFKNAVRERVLSFFEAVDTDPWVIKAGARAAAGFIVGASDPGGTEALRVNGVARALTLMVSNPAGAANKKSWQETAGVTNLDFQTVDDAGANPVVWLTAHRAVTTAVDYAQLNTLLKATYSVSTGRLAAGAGGSVYFTDDGGTERWIAGLTNVAAVRKWVVYDLINAWTVISVHETTGFVTLPKGLVVGTDPGSAALVRVAGDATFRPSDKIYFNAPTNTVYIQYVTATNRLSISGADIEFLQTEFLLNIAGLGKRLNVGAANSAGAGQRTVTVDN